MAMSEDAPCPRCCPRCGGTLFFWGVGFGSAAFGPFWFAILGLMAGFVLLSVDSYRTTRRRVTPPEVPRDRAPRNYAEQRALLDNSLQDIAPYPDEVQADEPVAWWRLGEEDSDLIRSERAEALREAAGNLLEACHAEAHAKMCRTQYMSDRTGAHVALDVAAAWLRTLADLEEGSDAQTS